MIFSFFKDKVPLVPKYLGVSSLEVLCPSIFLIQFFNQMLHPFIFLIRFSDWIQPLFPVYKLAFQILINTYELDFIASTSFTIYYLFLFFNLSELHNLNLMLRSKEYNKTNLQHQIVLPWLSSGWRHNYSTETRQVGCTNELTMLYIHKTC